MPTEILTTTCTNNATGTDNTCTIPLSDLWNGNVSTFNTPFFSAGDMFISLLLFILIILAIIGLLKSSVFNVSVHKKTTMHLDDIKQEIDL